MFFARSLKPAFRQGMLVGILAVLAARFVLDKSFLADWLVSPLLTEDTTGSADAIVVFGAGVVGPCLPNQSAVRRVAVAVDLWKSGRAPYVLFTGGMPEETSCSVSSAMARFATELGLPADRVLLEKSSHSTRENAILAAPVLETIEAHRVIVVTDRLHMIRASGSLRALGFAVERVSVPVYATHVGNLDMLGGGLREYVALGYYKVRGWLTESKLRPVTTNVKGGSVRTTVRFPHGPILILGASYAADWNPPELAGKRVVNRGVAGQQSFEIADRLSTEVEACSPRMVIVWGYINDIFRAPADGVTDALERTRASQLRMIDASRALGVDVVLVTEVPITGRGTWKERALEVLGALLRKTSYAQRVNTHVTATNAWIRDTAKKQGLTLLDLERVVAGSNGQRRREFAKPDGSHLTAPAYDAISTYAGPVLLRHLESTP